MKLFSSQYPAVIQERQSGQPMNIPRKSKPREKAIRIRRIVPKGGKKNGTGAHTPVGRPVTHVFRYSFNPLLIHLITNSFIHSIPSLLIHLITHSFIRTFHYSFITLLIHCIHHYFHFSFFPLFINSITH